MAEEIANIFPKLGLTAFILLWTHIVGGVFEARLRRYFDFDRYVRITSVIILICIILHPLLHFIILKFNWFAIFSVNKLYILLGIIGWVLLVTYDIGKIFIKRNFFARNWNNILLISTIGFFVILFHSLGLGGDLQNVFLRKVWILLGITAIAATIYTYAIKKILIKR